VRQYHLSGSTLTITNIIYSRPPNQRTYIASVEVRATRAHVKDFAFADPRSLALYILNVDQVSRGGFLQHDPDLTNHVQIREFRDRHWRFTKEYIIRRSSYGVATGGSPILQYLPQVEFPHHRAVPKNSNPLLLEPEHGCCSSR